VVISNWALEECREPSATSESNDAVASHPLRATWGLGEACIVGYSGDMGRAHRLDELIDAVSALGSQPRLRFVRADDGAQRAALEARVQGPGAEERDVPTVPTARTPARILEPARYPHRLAR
jgi:hypothetical protein